MNFSFIFLLQFYLQDTKSSNGTFVNSQRLSKGSEESDPFEVFSNDTVQFGVDVMENSKKGNLNFIHLTYML
jgi:pSer/pThr/pTyr-binding forkhead associated (FHA) protein